MTPDDDMEATQPKPAEGARAEGLPQAEQGSASGRSTQDPAEGSDEAAPPTEGSPVG